MNLTYTDKDGDVHQTVRSLMDAHNVTYEPQMGGGCTAFAFYHEDGSYHLITHEDGGEAPTEFNEPCIVGYYKDDECGGHGCEWCENPIQALAYVLHGDPLVKI